MDSAGRCSAVAEILENSGADSFIFRLNEQLSWNVAGTGGTSEWLNKWAGLMGLEPGGEETLPTIWFVRGAAPQLDGLRAPWPKDSRILDALEPDGWQVQDLRVIRMWRHPLRTELICELLNIPVDHIENTMMWQALHPLYEAVMYRGGFPLHAALVEHRGKGFLLAGAGGRGKTTCCERLPSDWTALSDDETLLIRSGKERPLAHPFPTWSAAKANGRSWQVSRNVEPAAIFFLEQSAEDRAVPMGRGEAAVRINQSANQSCFGRLRSLPVSSRKEWRKMLFQNSCDTAKVIPAYTLNLTKTGRFWEIIEEMIRNRD
jgi:SynChlorMet cassette protein ScmC